MFQWAAVFADVQNGLFVVVWSLIIIIIIFVLVLPCFCYASMPYLERGGVPPSSLIVATSVHSATSWCASASASASAHAEPAVALPCVFTPRRDHLQIIDPRLMP